MGKIRNTVRAAWLLLGIVTVAVLCAATAKAEPCTWTLAATTVSTAAFYVDHCGQGFTTAEVPCRLDIICHCGGGHSQAIAYPSEFFPAYIGNGDQFIFSYPDVSWQARERWYYWGIVDYTPPFTWGWIYGPWHTWSYPSYYNMSVFAIVHGVNERDRQACLDYYFRKLPFDYNCHYNSFMVTDCPTNGMPEGMLSLNYVERNTVCGGKLYTGGRDCSYQVTVPPEGPLRLGEGDTALAADTAPVFDGVTAVNPPAKIKPTVLPLDVQAEFDRINHMVSQLPEDTVVFGRIRKSSDPAKPLQSVLNGVPVPAPDAVPAK